MRYRRMPIEVESPEELGYGSITNNLSESSVADQRLSALGIEVNLDDLLLCYGDHRGHPDLRELIAGDRGRSEQGPARLSAGDVLVVPGAAAALFCVNTTVLQPGDHAVVIRTNYATNIETPLAIGADVTFVDLRFEDGYRLDVDRLAGMIRSDTKLVSLTNPHNPTGATMTREELEAVVDLVDRAGAVLLFDETYRELTWGEPLPMAASLSERAISVCSLSKAFGLPGLRLGWAVTADATLFETLLAAKEQILICGSTIDEAIGAEVLAGARRLLDPVKQRSRHHLDLVRQWIDGDDRFEWVEPGGGVVCFPWIRSHVDLNVDGFYDRLLDDFGTYVGPGHWFGTDRRNFRLGFGWPTTAELEAGLKALSAAATAATG